VQRELDGLVLTAVVVVVVTVIVALGNSVKVVAAENMVALAVVVGKIVVVVGKIVAVVFGHSNSCC